MKNHGLYGLSLAVLVLVLVPGTFGQLNVGKCSNKTWANSCTGGSIGNQCPTPCQVSISDNGTAATVTRVSNGTSANIICVELGAEVDWMEPADHDSFLVYFGSSTPFATKSAFTAGPSAVSKDNITNNADNAFECNKYLVLHCGISSCIPSDPIVIVHGGQTLMKPPNATGRKTGGEAGSAASTTGSSPQR